MTRPFTLAVFTKNRVNPAYAAARLAADRVAAEAGARTLHFVPTTPDDVGQQKALVGEALAAVPDAVVFVPVDDRQMVPDLARFADAGIPVVTCINRMEGKVVSFVGSDDVAVGHTAAQALFAALPGGGRIVAIDTPRNLRLAYGRPTVVAESLVDGALRRKEFPTTDDPGLLALLATGGVQTVHTREAALSDVFIAVTAAAA